jgi:hypothetical protein
MNEYLDVPASFFPQPQPTFQPGFPPDTKTDIMTIESWTEAVKQKQAEVASQIPTAWRLPAEYTDISQTKSTNVLDVPHRCGLLSPKQLEITEKYDATALLEKIHSQELSAYEVTEAFCIRAAIAQQVVCSSQPTAHSHGVACSSTHNRQTV